MPKKQAKKAEKTELGPEEQIKVLKLRVKALESDLDDAGHWKGVVKAQVSKIVELETELKTAVAWVTRFMAKAYPEHGFGHIVPESVKNTGGKLFWIVKDFLKKHGVVVNAAE